MYDTRILVSYLTGELLDKGSVSEASIINWKGEKSIVFLRTLNNGWHMGLLAPTYIYYQPVYSMAVTLILLGSALAIVLINILISVDKAKNKSDMENKHKSTFFDIWRNILNFFGQLPLHLLPFIATCCIQIDNLEKAYEIIKYLPKPESVDDYRLTGTISHADKER
jgi:hypothetical protein